jgi:hypothetical protein
MRGLDDVSSADTAGLSEVNCRFTCGTVQPFLVAQQAMAPMQPHSQSPMPVGRTDWTLTLPWRFELSASAAVSAVWTAETLMP